MKTLMRVSQSLYAATWGRGWLVCAALLAVASAAGHSKRVSVESSDE